jgi:mRNA interferase MazF
LTKQGYNDKLSLVVCVPITSRIKGSDFEHPISGLQKPGVALTHQVTTADWHQRKAFSCGMCDKDELDHVLAKVAALLGLRL